MPKKLFDIKKGPVPVKLPTHRITRTLNTLQEGEDGFASITAIFQLPSGEGVLQGHVQLFDPHSNKLFSHKLVQSTIWIKKVPGGVDVVVYWPIRESQESGYVFTPVNGGVLEAGGAGMYSVISYKEVYLPGEAFVPLYGDLPKNGMTWEEWAVVKNAVKPLIRKDSAA